MRYTRRPVQKLWSTTGGVYGVQQEGFYSGFTKHNKRGSGRNLWSRPGGVTYTGELHHEGVLHKGYGVNQEVTEYIVRAPVQKLCT
jgi:hypothetical protein